MGAKGVCKRSLPGFLHPRFRNLAQKREAFRWRKRVHRLRGEGWRKDG